MRYAMSFLALLALANATRPARAQEITIITGTVRVAKSRAPIAGAAVLGEVAVAARDSVGSYTLHLPGATTDSSGQFTLRLPRNTSTFEVRRNGFLDFRFPLLKLVVDTLRMDIEMRSDPLTPDLYVVGGRGYLPFLCVIVDDFESRFDVLHSCLRSSYDASRWTLRGYKHNPESPYFGTAGDWGGVLVATRRRR
jgi:carboxypeptidase family protein